MSKNTIVKSNRLNTATQNLSLSEVRIMQLAIIDSRETGTGLSPDKPLVISASRYAEVFNVTKQTAYEAILDAEKNLFERRFSFIDSNDKMVKSRWVQRVKYLHDAFSIEIILTYDVVNEITRIDGYEQFFTQYLLEQTASMKSSYSVRLYELLIQWKKIKKTPTFNLEYFRLQLGVHTDEYKLMSDFKKRVLDSAITEINQHTDIDVTYEQHKAGRTITGFTFKFTVKPDKKKENNQNPTQLKMTNKQRRFFAAQLARLPALAALAKQGEDYDEFATHIEKDLGLAEKTACYLPHLKSLGFEMS